MVAGDDELHLLKHYRESKKRVYILNEIAHF